MLSHVLFIFKSNNKTTLKFVDFFMMLQKKNKLAPFYGPQCMSLYGDGSD